MLQLSARNLHIILSKEDRKTLESWQHSEVVSSATANRARVILLLDDGLTVNDICRAVGFSRNSVYRWVKRFRSHGTRGLFRPFKKTKLKVKNRKLHKVKAAKRCNNFEIKISDKDRMLLNSWQRCEIMDAGLVRRGRVILYLAEGKTVSETSKIIGMSRQQIYVLANRFKLNGVEGLQKSPMSGIRKAEEESIRSLVFSILHSPPSEYNINRTSWRLVDIKKCLADKGVYVSKNLISEIVKSAGYSYRKAKTVLTSKDPDYRKKLEQITAILSGLGDRDFFFSIDELGPIAIKIRGGKKLVGPDEYPTIPQYQKTKGCLIITAALELKSNHSLLL